MDEQLQDKNNNGVPDWAEERFDDQTEFAEGPMGMGYRSEEAIAKNIPNYKDYKWYKQPEENYYYTLGEAIDKNDTQKVENLIESNPEQAQEVLTGDLKKEAEQIADGDKRTDEVSNEVVEKELKKPGSFLIDVPTYNDMSIDDIEKADALAMSGEAPYMQVEGNENNVEDIVNDYPTELPQEEEQIEEQEKKDITLPEIASSDMSIENVGGANASLPSVSGGSAISSNPDNIIPNESLGTTSGVSPIDPTFSGGGSAGVTTSGIDVNIEENTSDMSSNAAGGEVNTEVSEDGNTGTMTGENKAIDDTLDSLSFKETDHEENIKAGKADLPDGDITHSASPSKNKLPSLKGSEKTDLKAIKDKIIEDSATWGSNNSGTKYLPFKFIVNGEDVEVSQVGTGRKESFDAFIKNEPKALRQIISLI